MTTEQKHEFQQHITEAAETLKHYNDLLELPFLDYKRLFYATGEIEAKVAEYKNTLHWLVEEFGKRI